MLWLLLVPSDRAEVWDCVIGTVRILIIDDPGGVGGVGVGCHGRTRVDNEGVFVFCGKKCMLQNMPTSVIVKILLFNLATWLPTLNLATKLGNLVAKFEVGSQVAKLKKQEFSGRH